MVNAEAIPYGRHSLDDADINAVLEVLNSAYLTQGPKVPAFEEAICSRVNAKFGVAVNSATSALHLACLAVGIGEGDLVWTSPNTFVASANVVLMCGAKVDFVDIDRHTLNLCVIKLEEKLKIAKRVGVLPKAVIAVHFSGLSCDMSRICALSKEYGFRIIEDASHALGATLNNKPVGSSIYSDISIFSFHPVKMITTCEGGLAATNDRSLATRMQQLREHGIKRRSFEESLNVDSEIWGYEQLTLGYNYRLTEIQAALGISQLKKLNKFLELRRAQAKCYDENLHKLPVQTPVRISGVESSYHLYTLVLDKGKTAVTQKFLFQHLRQQGVHCNIHYIPVYRHPYFSSLGFEEGYCPEAENYFKNCISIPIFPTMTLDQQTKVISALKETFL